MSKTFSLNALIHVSVEICKKARLFSNDSITGNVEINGLKDTISYLKSLGGSPFISGDSWDPSQFDIKNVFIKNPAAALYILLNYKFESYKFPLTDETPASYNGLKKMDLWGSAYDEDYYVDTKEMLEEVYNIYLLETVKKELVVSQISQAMDRVIAFRSVSDN